jgi:uracil-DNA glycosylase
MTLTLVQKNINGSFSLVRACQICAGFLPNLANPMIQDCRGSHLLIVGQAPGIPIHKNINPGMIP